MLRPRGTASCALVLGLALSGCGAGFEAQTYQERSSADSVNAAVGTIAVRNLSVLPESDGVLEAGDDAEVRVTLVNNGAEDDRLVEASSPEASSVELLSEGSESSSVDLPRLGTTGNQLGLVLTSLRDDVYAGDVVEVVLRFERAGEITLQAPVAVTNEYDDERERSENFHVPGEEHSGEGGGQESEGAGSLSEAGEESTSDTG